MSSDLHIACLNDRIDEVKRLLDEGVDCNVCDADGHTPLHLACMRTPGEKIDIVCLLIARGANVNIKNNKGCTPLHTAVSWCSLNSAKLLIAAGVDVNIKEDNGFTAFATACNNGYVHFIKLFLESGADANQKINDTTVLHLAVKSGNFASVKFLLEAGANMLALNGENKTPLDIAKYMNSEAVEILS